MTSPIVLYRSPDQCHLPYEVLKEKTGVKGTRKEIIFPIVMIIYCHLLDRYCDHRHRRGAHLSLRLKPLSWYIKGNGRVCRDILVVSRGLVIKLHIRMIYVRVELREKVR